MTVLFVFCLVLAIGNFVMLCINVKDKNVPVAVLNGTCLIVNFMTIQMILAVR
jgi:hypothetical protein